MASEASAQATRTWVSGVGSDSNPCTRTAPCATFAGAFVNTAAGGTINCLDSGGFGEISIYKSITIDCEGTKSGIIVAGTYGITVNDGGSNSVVVVIRGLTIDGQQAVPVGAPPPNTPAAIRVLGAASVVVENVVLRNFTAAGGVGISFAPGGSTKLTVSNATITNNASAGIFVQPINGNGAADVVIDNSRLVQNGGIGLAVNTTGNTSAAGSRVAVRNSVVSNNTLGGVNVNTPVSYSKATVSVFNSTIANNASYGVVSNGSLAVVNLSGNQISGSSFGIRSAAGGTLNSYGDNILYDNTSNSSATTVAKQ